MRAVVTRRLADVVDVVRLRGFERRFERALTRGGDRPGRQAAHLARVVGRVAVEVALVDLAVVSPLARGLRGVDDRRVDSERDIPSEPVVDDRGDDGALVGELRFRIDELGDGDNLTRGEARRRRVLC